MANDYFEFKKFRIKQDRCSMKVGTDGALLGAWANCKHAKRILDIGTGTGLIALMMAQRNPTAEITAIEIDDSACQQAAENFSNSIYSSRIAAKNVALQEFDSKEKFGLIISNPPFFHQEGYLSDKESRNTARHTVDLSHSDLLFYAKKKSHKGWRHCVNYSYELR